MMNDEQRDLLRRGAANAARQNARQAHDTDATIQSLRLQLADAYEAIGAALALLNQRQTDRQVDAAIIVLDDALKGKVTP